MGSAHQKLEREADRRLEREAKAKGASTLNSTIETFGRKLRGSDPTEVPQWTEAILIQKARCTPLEPIAGRIWYDWPERRFELEEYGELLDPNDPSIGRTTYFQEYQDAGGYLLQPVRAHVRGTNKARSSVVAKTPAPLAAQAPIDVLDLVSMVTGYGGAGRYAVRGRDEVVARLGEVKHVEFPSLGSGRRLVTSAGGRLTLAQLIELWLTSPLVLSESDDCEVTAGCKLRAITLALALPAPIRWCGNCGGDK